MRVLITEVDGYLGWPMYIFKDLIPNRERIEDRKEARFPDIRWDGSRRKSKLF